MIAILLVENIPPGSGLLDGLRVEVARSHIIMLKLGDKSKAKKQVHERLLLFLAATPARRLRGIKPGDDIAIWMSFKEFIEIGDCIHITIHGSSYSMDTLYVGDFHTLSQPQGIFKKLTNLLCLVSAMIRRALKFHLGGQTSGHLFFLEGIC